MSTAVFLLGLVALASVVGTVLLQQQPAAHYQQTFGPFWAQVWHWLGFERVYSVWWYLALLSVVVLSVLACLYTNGWAAWRRWRQAGPPRLWPSVVAAWPVQRRLNAQQQQRLLTRAPWGWQGASPTAWFYQRGQWRVAGYWAAHVGVVVLAIGGLLTGCVGFRGMVHLPAGAGLDAVWLPRGEASRAERLPFTLVNHGFSLTAHADGTPASFMTDVGLLVPGAPPQRAQLTVNQPLRWGPYSIYQSSYGDAGSPVVLYWAPRVGVGEALATAVYAQATPTVTPALTLAVLGAQAHERRPQLDPQTGQTLGYVDAGPSVDVLLTLPDRPPRALRLYLKVPDVVGVATAQRADGTFAFVPVALGVNPANPAAWGVVQAVLAAGATASSAAAVLGALPVAVVAALPPEQRAATVLQAWQAAQVLSTLDLPGLPVLQAWDPRYYTALQVTYDPGFWWFVGGSILLTLGIMLMLYVDHQKVWLWRRGQQWYLAATAVRDWPQWERTLEDVMA